MDCRLQYQRASGRIATIGGCYFPKKAISYSTCEYCDQLFVVRRQENPSRPVTCCRHPECRRKYNNQRVRQFQREHKERTGSHYMARYREQRIVATRAWWDAHKVERTCEVCQRVWRAKRPEARFCSPRCWGSVSRIDRLPVLHPNPFPLSWLPPRHPARLPEPRPARMFVAGWCPHDGAPFVVESQLTSRYCSDRCQRASHRRLRRARARASGRVWVNRFAIFERDGWLCGICGDPVDRDAKVPDLAAPVLDHIVPLARGGIDAPDNLRCAHYYCNSVKRDQLDEEMVA